MTPSFAALQLGHVPWVLKQRQDSLWEGTDIEEVHDPLDEIESALAVFAPRMTGMQREAITEIVNRICLRHRKGADLNLDEWFSLLGQEAEHRLAVYREFLREDETAKMFQRWQREDRQCLHDALKVVVAGDRRIEGYFEIGDHIGETADGLAQGRISMPLSEDRHQHARSGMGKLPLRERRVIERFFPAQEDEPAIVLTFRTIKKLGRFLSTHEDYLTAKPHWDGKTITYQGRSEEIRLQHRHGVIGLILDQGQKADWTDDFDLPALTGKDPQRSARNAVYHFNKEHHILRLSINGHKVIWF